MADSIKFITSIRETYDDTIAFDEELRPKQSVFSMIGEALEDLIFEEEERPIGMTQLVRGTFSPASQNQPGVFFKHAPTIHDYQFLRGMEKPVYGQALRRSWWGWNRR